MRYFQKVCEYNNFTRAAQALYVSQPAISANIKELEKEFNVKLFSRKNNKIIMTEEGEILFEKVNGILKQIDDLVDQMQSLTSNQTINVGVPPMIGEIIFPHIFYEFREFYPKLNLNIVECGSKQLLDLVKDDEIDVGFGIVGENIDEHLETYEIFKTQLVFAVNREHSMANFSNVNFPALENESLIVMKDDSYQHRKIKNIFANIGLEPKIVLYSNQLNTIKKILSNGDAGAFIIKEIAENDSELIGIPLEEPIDLDIRLIWKKSSDNDRIVMNFIKFVKEYNKRVTIY